MAGVKCLREPWGVKFTHHLRAPTQKHTHCEVGKHKQRQPLNHKSEKLKLALNQSVLGSNSLWCANTRLVLVSKTSRSFLPKLQLLSSLLMFPVVEATVFTVLRKVVIILTNAFTEHQNEAPDGKAFCCALRRAVTVIILVDIYTGNPSFCTCCFFFSLHCDDCAKAPCLWRLLILRSQGKHRLCEMFSFGAFHHSLQSVHPFDPLFDTLCWRLCFRSSEMCF